jgi:acetyl-CoA carboxylase/biotin carboxylase 1
MIYQILKHPLRKAWLAKRKCVSQYKPFLRFNLEWNVHFLSSHLFRFPAKDFCDKILNFRETISDPSEKTTFTALVTPLLDAASPYTNSNTTGVIGSERALQGFLTILRNWIDVERWFSDGKAYADAVDILRKSNADNYEHVLNVCRTHAGLKSTAALVERITESIADGLRLESDNAFSKPSSVVAGAHSLRDAVPCLSEIGSMGGNQYVNVALTARKVLLQESLPSIEQRKSRISDAVKDLSEVLQAKDSSTPDSVTSLVDEGIPLADVFYPLVSSLSEKKEKVALAELYVRKLYNSQSLGAFSRDVEDMRVQFTFNAKGSERIFSASTPVTSMTDLTRAISRSGSLQQLADLDGNSSSQLPPNTSRTAVCKLANSLEQIGTLETSLASFPQYTGASPKCKAGPTNILYIIVMEEIISNTQESMDSLSAKLQSLLEPLHHKLNQADVRRVSFIYNSGQSDLGDMYPLPLILTFRAQSNFKEDSLFRNIEPGLAYLLDLTRLSKNFTIKLLDSQQAHSGDVHLYKATPRASALAMDKKANSKSRIYARTLNFISEFTSTSFEKMLVDAMNALDIAVHEYGYCVDNHLFLNMVSDHEKLILDPVSVENTVVSILKRHGDRIAALGLSEVETKLVCSLTSDSPPIALRMVASNPTGYVHVMNTYVEAVDPSSSTPIFKLIGGTKASLSSSGDSSWEGTKITSPYPLTKPFEMQRKAALRASDSLYCYDIPALFEAAVEKQWSAAAEKGGIEGDIRAASRPHMVMYTSELVVERKNKDSPNWTMQDYLNGDLTLAQTQRRAGANDVGMVAWLMTLKTVEYPEVSFFLVKRMTYDFFNPSTQS